MSKELVEIFEGQEVKVVTDQGVVMYNLGIVAKTFGVENKIVEGLQNILNAYSLLENENAEIENVLSQIYSGKELDQIYISRKLVSLLSFEGDNKATNRYHDYLAKLGDSYAKYLIEQNKMIENISRDIATKINAQIPNMVEDIVSNIINLK
nr:MAG TPA: hypothetical protein [Caudoviricetes sp.]